MDSPARYLPSISEGGIRAFLDSIGLPKPSTIKPLSVTAEFHKIWSLIFDGPVLENLLHGVAPAEAHNELILRVAGNHIPQIKTENEISILNFLHTQTSIPVPRVVRHDATANNALNAEYMLMTRIKGVTGSDVYDMITEEQMDVILDQLVDYHLQIHSQPFEHIGGLRLQSSGSYLPGPVLDEYFWQTPEIEEYWPTKETFKALNPDSPNGYPDFVAWIIACVIKYMYAIGRHPSLQWFTKSDIQMLADFVPLISVHENRDRIDRGIRYVLAHRDLHFANMLLDPETHRIVGILDWEFAQVVPLPLWRRSFLWNGRRDKTSRSENERLYGLWEGKMKKTELGRRYLADAEWQYPEQKFVFEVCDYVRCIVEVCPRGQFDKPYKEWWGICKSSMQKLGIQERSSSEG